MLPPDISLFLGELCAFGTSGLTGLVRSLLHRLRPIGVDNLRQLWGRLGRPCHVTCLLKRGHGRDQEDESHGAEGVLYEHLVKVRHEDFRSHESEHRSEPVMEVTEAL